jgi:hypothetical protein
LKQQCRRQGGIDARAVAAADDQGGRQRLKRARSSARAAARPVAPRRHAARAADERCGRALRTSAADGRQRRPASRQRVTCEPTPRNATTRRPCCRRAVRAATLEATQRLVKNEGKTKNAARAADEQCGRQRPKRAQQRVSERDVHAGARRERHPRVPVVGNEHTRSNARLATKNYSRFLAFEITYYIFYGLREEKEYSPSREEK